MKWLIITIIIFVVNVSYSLAPPTLTEEEAFNRSLRLSIMSLPDSLRTPSPVQTKRHSWGSSARKVMAINRLKKFKGSINRINQLEEKFTITEELEETIKTEEEQLRAIEEDSDSTDHDGADDIDSTTSGDSDDFDYMNNGFQMVKFKGHHESMINLVRPKKRRSMVSSALESIRIKEGEESSSCFNKNIINNCKSTPSPHITYRAPKTIEPLPPTPTIKFKPKTFSKLETYSEVIQYTYPHENALKPLEQKQREAYEAILSNRPYPLLISKTKEVDVIRMKKRENEFLYYFDDIDNIHLHWGVFLTMQHRFKNYSDNSEEDYYDRDGRWTDKETLFILKLLKEFNNYKKDLTLTDEAMRRNYCA